jgi:DNA (cytosine-5)-methyltransferase 1
MKPTFIDLFGAPGGMSRGFQMAGFKPLGMLDIFEDGVNTYRKNFPKVPDRNAVLADASNPNIIKHFEKETGLKPGDIDVIVGGPPCQGFSTVGRVMIGSLVRKGMRTGRSKNPRFIDDHRNNLYKSFVKFVKHFKPKAVVMENVPGMMSYKDGDTASQIKSDLVASGYGNTEFGVINAEGFGVPQKRKRIIFLGTRNGKKINFPVPTHLNIDEGQETLDGIPAPVTVDDAFSDLPKLDLPERGVAVQDNPMEYASAPKNEFQEIMRGDSDVLHNHITRWHRKNDVKIFKTMKQGMRWKDLPDKYRKLIGYDDSSFNDKWKRLVLDEPSWTVVAHLQKDGYMYIHPTENRTVSVREAARLQSFPDSFVFTGSRGSQFRQIGNAVPPLFAKAIAETVNKSIS